MPENVDGIYIICIIGFYYEVRRKASPDIFGRFRKKLLQSLTNRECFINLITTKHDKELIQSVRGITKCETFYRVRIITKLNGTKGKDEKENRSEV